MASLCHPRFTTTNRSYRFPIFETSATALCGTTGNIEYNSFGQITYMYIFNIFIYMPGKWHVLFFSLLSLSLTLRKSLYVNYGELNNFPSVYYSHAQYIKDKICSLQLWWKPRAFCLPTQTKPLFKFGITQSERNPLIYMLSLEKTCDTPLHHNTAIPCPQINLASDTRSLVLSTSPSSRFTTCGLKAVDIAPFWTGGLAQNRSHFLVEW